MIVIRNREICNLVDFVEIFDDGIFIFFEKCYTNIYQWFTHDSFGKLQ